MEPRTGRMFELGAGREGRMEVEPEEELVLL